MVTRTRLNITLYVYCLSFKDIVLSLKTKTQYLEVYFRIPQSVLLTTHWVTSYLRSELTFLTINEGYIKAVGIFTVSSNKLSGAYLPWFINYRQVIRS